MGRPSLPKETGSHTMKIHKMARTNQSDADICTRLYQILEPNKHFGVVILMLFSFLGYTACLTDNLFPGGDNARYLILAKALLTGNGYRNIGIVTAPYHTLAPPGFPMLLTLVIAVFGMNVVIAKMLVGTSGIISIGVVYAMFRRKYDSRYAAGIALLYGTAPLVFMYARRVYSDLPFVVISLLALWAVDRYASHQSLFNRWLLLAGLAIAVAFYLRPVALALLLASSLWLIIRKKIPRGALLFLLVALLIAPWYDWVRRISADVAPGHLATFLSQGGLLELVRRVLTNSMGYSQLFTENIFYVTTKGPAHLGLNGSLPCFLAATSSIFISLLIIAGFIHCVRKELQLSEIYVVVYFAVLLSYSLVLDRFIIPILPFVIHYCIQGLIILIQKVMRPVNVRGMRIIIYSFLFCAVLSNGVHIAARLYQEQNFAKYAPDAARYYEIAQWAGMHLPDSAAVATDYPDFFYVYADRQAVMLNKEIVQVVEEGIVQFVITDRSQFFQVQGWLGQLNDRFSISALYCANGSELCLYEIIWPTSKDNS